MKAAAAVRSASAVAAIALLAGCTSTNLHPGTLAGTSWRVATVNGTPTPAAGAYGMQFQPNGQFGARFGCNHMGGEYRLSGSTLTVSNVASTLMGCPEPAQSFENQGGAVLGQPMEVSFGDDARMTLSNSAGSIALDPVR